MNVKITYRHKKSGISMRVLKSGDISVSAPYGVSRERVMDFINSNSEWIEQALNTMAQRQQRRQDFFSRLPLQTHAQAKEASKALSEIIKPFLDKYQREMDVTVRRVAFSNARGRWGSCNPGTASIRFSIYLLLLPHWCIEHVVVHELAHLKVPNHSQDFYAVMDRHFPRWREARAETRHLLKSR